MSITVLTPAVSRRVTDPVTLEEQTGLKGRQAERLIDAVTTAFENYCGRVFAFQRYEERLGSVGGTILQLQHVPLLVDTGTNTIEVIHKTNAVDDFEVRDLERGWLFRRKGWAPSHILRSGLTIEVMDEPPADDYTVTYSAGWTMPGEENRNFPVDLEAASWEAILQMALNTGVPINTGDAEDGSAFNAQLVQNLRRLGLTQFRVGDTQVSFASGGAGTGTAAANQSRGTPLSLPQQQFPPTVMAVLERYKSWL